MDFCVLACFGISICIFTLNTFAELKQENKKCFSNSIQLFVFQLFTFIF